MSGRILYAGDTRLDGPAAYMAGLLHRRGLSFDYVPGGRPLGPALTSARHGLYLISDFPVKDARPQALQRVASEVRGGAALVMLGGWESFHGAAGEYVDSPLEEVLPVRLAREDDRVNCPQPCLIEPADEHASRHPILHGLPLACPPAIGGYNRFTVAPGGQELLRARRFKVRRGADGEWDFASVGCDPLLVVGSFGAGRVAALATDVAPHWVGGLVDWGERRVCAHAPGAEEVEVGEHYAELFTRLVLWGLGLL
jgi:hypothetical protein